MQVLQTADVPPNQGRMILAMALEGIDDPKVLASPQTTYALLHIVVHNNEIYGNIAGYLRSNGIVPPSTASRMGQAGKK